MEFEAVIGLEVHVQIKTKSKMFSSCEYIYGQPPNTLTDPVVLALPGTLPVINKFAVRQAIRAGMLFGCKIADVSKWDRKNYFYPDCPKNYQITQNDLPLCLGGEVEIELEGPSRNIMGMHKKIKLNRIHLEEDVGKLTHCGTDSLVDYNRAGVPLIEIVSEPDMHSAEEAFAYLNSLRMHLVYAGISDCDMEKGQMRCDANVSIRPVGQQKLGTKVELKNLNSISGVRHGIEYEIRRQQAIIEHGGAIHQDTMRWDAEANVTTVMRNKETAHDYRYFTDPDLMPIKIPAETKKEIAATIPELPFAKQTRFFKTYDLPYTVTSVLCPDRGLSDYFEDAVKHYSAPKIIANFVVNDLLRESGTTDWSTVTNKLPAERLAELAQLIDKGVISKQVAKEVFTEMYRSRQPASELVKKLGLDQTTNDDELQSICQDAINNNPKAVDEFLSGKEPAINALKGQVMKATKGKANPQVIDKILRQLLAK